MPYGLVEDHGGNVVKPFKGAGAERDQKREAAIQAKEKARENKERERARAGAGGATTPAQKRADLDAKREADMRKKDEERVARIRVADEKLARQHEADALKPKLSSAKYSKKEVLILFDLFKEYDEDGSGNLSISEFKQHFKKRNDESARYDGKSKNFAQRRAARAGLNLATMVEPMFLAVDKDQSGTITFFELLSLLYPLANEQDLATFKSWCYPEEPKQKIKYVLSAEQRAELKEMFRIIDKDRSGELTVEELMTMFSGSSITGEKGVNEEELKVFFAEADFDNSHSINLPEFEQLMISTGLYTPETPESPEQAAEREKKEAAAAADQSGTGS